jgi:hypothetical protein
MLAACLATALRARWHGFRSRAVKPHRPPYALLGSAPFPRAPANRIGGSAMPPNPASRVPCRSQLRPPAGKNGDSSRRFPTVGVSRAGGSQLSLPSLPAVVPTLNVLEGCRARERLQHSIPFPRTSFGLALPVPCPLARCPRCRAETPHPSCRRRQRDLDHSRERKSHAPSNDSRPLSLGGPLSRRPVMEYSLKNLLVIVALGAAVASPAFARAERHHQTAAISGMSAWSWSLWLPRDANIYDRNQEGYPRPRPYSE